MTEASEEIAGSADDEMGRAGLQAQLAMMFRALWASPVRNTLLELGAGVLVVILATTYGQVRLNRWNQPFFNALERRDMREFMVQLGVFGVLVAALLVLNVSQRWLTEMLKLKLREGLMRDLVGAWLRPGRAFRLANAGPIGVNPDQRMHEDARHLTELSADLGVGLLQSSILLASFITVLWVLSGGITLNIGGRALAVPGFMVWAAIVYSGSASLLSYWVGRSLVPRNAERYAREADLRIALVRTNEHIDSISLASGEADEARRIGLDLDAVLQAMRRLVSGLTNLTWITAGYGWLTLVVPILVAAGPYFAGRLSFGGLMMAAGAFTQVQSSLRWFIDNFSIIADWRATLLRVATFRRAVFECDQLHGVESAIAFSEGEPGRFVMNDLEVASPAGCTSLAERKAEVHSAERVLISGPDGTGKTLLFRALAGLWPWGGGSVIRPRGETILFLPRSPYLPPGTLHEALAYPQAAGSFAREACVGALERLGFAKLAPLLEVSGRWDHQLSEDEQQGVALARALLHAPAWVVIDDALESLDAEAQQRVFEIFRKELARTAVIHIGRCHSPEPLFSRELHLVNNPVHRRLRRPGPRAAKPSVAALAPGMAE